MKLIEPCCEDNDPVIQLRNMLDRFRSSSTVSRNELDLESHLEHLNELIERVRRLTTQLQHEYEKICPDWESDELTNNDVKMIGEICRMSEQ